jgi:Holliday junction resolvasome RuvABC endonuclease subunit
MKIRRVLALDQASSTGYAESENIVAGHRRSATVSFSAPTVAAKLLSFEEWLRRKVVSYGPDLIVYEQPVFGRFGNRQNGKWLIGLAAVIEMTAERYGRPYIDMPQDEIKKLALGEGRARSMRVKAAYDELLREGKSEKAARAGRLKRAVIHATRERGWNVVNDDEAEALWMLECVRQLAANGRLKI